MTDDANPPPLQTSEVGFVSLQPGQAVGRYEIVAVLGHGGFGITYRAHDRQLHRDVALKEYLPSSLAVRQGGTTVLPRSTDAAADFAWGRDRFVDEGRTLASLGEASAIVRVHDFLEANGTAYIVMELVRGETLDHRLKQKGKLTPAEVEAILWPLLEGLSQVHDAGFLHRDIKPANILLNTAGKPTLIDFGASRAAMAGRTTALTAIFTPGYAAAEQMTAARQGPWTDIYGLAATLHHAVTGSAPPSAIERALEDTYLPLVESAPAGFSHGLLAGIDAGLEVRAPDRPQTIAEWRPILTQKGSPSDAATVLVPRGRPAPAVAPPKPSGTKSGNRLRLAGIAVALLLVVAAGGYFLFAAKPANQGTNLQDMKVEDLERALEARRKADAEAADKRRLEEEARRKAAVEGDSKLAADAALEKAQKERQEAEAELARVKAEIEEQKKVAAQQADAQRQAAAEEAQRKAEADAADKRRLEEEAQKKAAVETESKRRADADLAKAQAEREKAEAEAKAKSAGETDRKAAEAAEAALRLAATDRQRLQVALTAAGFDTRGSDGNFGPRTREMIAAWQKARQMPATGFLDASQFQTLQREASAVLKKYDEEQKKAEEEKKKLEEEAKAKAAVAAPIPPQPAAPAAGLAIFDGAYEGGVAWNIYGASMSNAFAVNVKIAGNRLTGEVTERRCGTYPITATVSASGEISGEAKFFEDAQCVVATAKIVGRVSGDVLNIELQMVRAKVFGALRKKGG